MWLLRGIIMLNVYTVSFFGHRQIENAAAIEKRLDEIIRPLLLEKEYAEFLVGRDGEFDQLAASAVKRLKRSVGGDNSALMWVLPYPTAEYRDYETDLAAYYDEIEVCPTSAGGGQTTILKLEDALFRGVLYFYPIHCSFKIFDILLARPHDFLNARTPIICRDIVHSPCRILIHNHCKLYIHTHHLISYSTQFTFSLN